MRMTAHGRIGFPQRKENLRRGRRIPRDLATKILFLLDECIPPIVRDARWFMYIPLWLAFGDKVQVFLNFKEQAPKLSEAEFAEIYSMIRSVAPERETDLNAGCMSAILEGLAGRTVLEVGCGRGLLAHEMSRTHRVMALDIVLDHDLLVRYPHVRFVRGNIERLPFRDREFDTVVCTHTLEHAQDLSSALSELRRVTRKRLIVVVPKQRPYRYTFDLHLHFCPYEASLLMLMRTPDAVGSCRAIEGDLFYLEDRSAAIAPKSWWNK